MLKHQPRAGGRRATPVDFVPAEVGAGEFKPRVRLVLAAALLVLLMAVLYLVAWAIPARAAPVFTAIDPTDAPDANLNGQCASTHQGLCTLRAAVQEAEHAGGGEVILSAGYGPYQLTIPGGAEVDPNAAANAPTSATGDLDISTSVTVTGAGADVSVIDGDDAVRVFDVHGGGFLRVRGVSIQNGKGDYDSATRHSHGGAIHNHGTLSLSESVVADSASAATWGGGGITNAGPIPNFPAATARLQNVTVAKNSTDSNGGGIENGGDLRMLNVTVAENTALGQGGGIFTAGTTGPTNTIVALNRGGNCATAGAGSVSSGGNNLDGDGTCKFAQTTDLQGDPGFEAGPFGVSGAPVFYALLATSAAVDTGSPQVGFCPATDVRGVLRPQDGNGDGIALCDIGS